LNRCNATFCANGSSVHVLLGFFRNTPAKSTLLQEYFSGAVFAQSQIEFPSVLFNVVKMLTQYGIRDNSFQVLLNKQVLILFQFLNVFLNAELLLVIISPLKKVFFSEL